MLKLTVRHAQPEFPYFTTTIIAILLVIGFASMVTEQPVCELFDACEVR